MPLEPLPSDVTQQPDTGDAAADRPASFRDRKMAQLHDEPQPSSGRRETLAESDDPEAGYPDDEYQQDDEGHASDVESDAPGALEELSPEPDDDTADDDDNAELSYDDLMHKYKSLEKEHSRVTANRKQIEQDFSDGIAENITFRHQLEDLTQQAQQRAQFFLQAADQKVTQWENMDWGRVEPEKMASMKRGYQKAVADRDQLKQIFEATQTQSSQARELIKKREAEIARNVLQRRIPNWSDEHYGVLREHAATIGWSFEEYNELTDWRIIDLIHNDWNAKQAVGKVRNVKQKRQARAPRNRNARQQPRNADGRYRKSRDEAFSNPGDKGSFRDMKMRQMERERREGR